MLEQPFYIDHTGDRPTICNQYTEMRIEIFNLEKEVFSEPPGKFALFGNDHGAIIAFLVHYDHYRTTEITKALTWYAGYLDQSLEEMNISAIDPRPPGFMRVVK